jgi:hypothetical protein
MPAKYLISAALLIASSIAQANNLQTFNTTIVCTDLEGLSDTVESFGEKAAMNMTHTREIEGEIVVLPAVLFINYATKSWTLAEQVNRNFYCILGVGDNIGPYTPKSQ